MVIKEAVEDLGRQLASQFMQRQWSANDYWIVCFPGIDPAISQDRIEVRFAAKESRIADEIEKMIPATHQNYPVRKSRNMFAGPLKPL